MTTPSNKHIIEINGVKLEVDLRTATRLDTIKVGTRVKVLKKEYSTYKVHHGVVIGFEPFNQLPTIIIACALVEYSTAKIDFVYYNSETKDVEVVVAVDDDTAALNKEHFICQVNREISQKQNEIKALEERKEYFLSRFQSYWAPLEQAVADATEGVEL